MKTKTANGEWKKVFASAYFRAKSYAREENIMLWYHTFVCEKMKRRKKNAFQFIFVSQRRLKLGIHSSYQVGVENSFGYQVRCVYDTIRIF